MITIRPAHIEDAPGIANVHIDTWRTTYAGIVPQAYLDQLSYEERTRRWNSWLSNPQTYTYVAEDESRQIVGFVSGGPENTGDPTYKAELYAIYILKAYQGQGTGRRLTETLVKRLLQEGMTSMLLWTLPTSPASRFYEALGGQQSKTKQAELGGIQITEVAYGWTNLHTLLEDHDL
jgi:ribosomal protein S18 acetylase RimI-like enzyme